MTIRRIPADFRVDEVLSEAVAAQPSRSAVAGVGLIGVTKAGLTTPEAVGRVARLLGVRPGHIEPAGLKDKHAVTMQHMSVRWTAQGDGPEIGTRWSDAGIEVVWMGWIAAPLTAEAIRENRFEIVVRDLSRQANAQMSERAARLGGDGVLPVINYFGDQRFGSARHGHGFAGPHLCRGEFLEAVRLLIATPARKDTGRKRAFTRAAATGWGEWSVLAESLPRCPERRAVEVLAAGGSARDAFSALPYMTQQFAVESFQSWLWNRTAAGMVASSCAADGVISADDDFGLMLFPERRAWPAGWIEGPVHVPMLGRGTELEPPWGEAAASALEESGLKGMPDIPGLRRPAFREAMRPLAVEATGFEMGGAERDELARGAEHAARTRLKRTLRFSLPRGAYATVVLRALGQ